jgi:hypothetical protein
LYRAEAVGAVPAIAATETEPNFKLFITQTVQLSLYQFEGEISSDWRSGATLN